MKDQLPSSDPDRQSYERPNQNWVCGWACDGNACALGPSAKGECRAKSECRPVLETKPGETKGRWRCTRSTVHGGPCECGPLPDGQCSRPIPKCAPQRSLRALRGMVCIAVVALTMAVLLVLLYGKGRRRFISPGEVTMQHAGAGFVVLKEARQDEDGCSACHTAGSMGPAGWLQAAFLADPNPWQVHRLPQRPAGDLLAIDRTCLNCHPGRDFHQPNTVRDHSCSACHREHQGRQMPPPDDRNCATCHNQAGIMQASIAKGRQLPGEAFAYHQNTGHEVFRPARPEAGRTTVFSSFSGKHPEFQIHREALKETNTLRFNHAVHLMGAIPKLNGESLTCSHCHQPDAAGRFIQRISFDRHCHQCHSLQFDVNEPALQLPHGNADAVRTFLRALPLQYERIARERGAGSAREADQFVQERMRTLRAAFASGEALERHVFFTVKPLVEKDEVPSGVSLRARFAGCAYCHEVKTTANGAPHITPPVMPDRWMPSASFNHAKHLSIGCANCHRAAGSRDTADILMPTKDDCIRCHSPRGRISESCSTCHGFHNMTRK